MPENGSRKMIKKWETMYDSRGDQSGSMLEQWHWGGQGGGSEEEKIQPTGQVLGKNS